ncbi:hypothetical protein BDW69DRAFT_159609 [Aspergillus filifer]
MIHQQSFPTARQTGKHTCSSLLLDGHYLRSPDGADAFHHLLPHHNAISPIPDDSCPTIMIDLVQKQAIPIRDSFFNYRRSIY